MVRIHSFPPLDNDPIISYNLSMDIQFPEAPFKAANIPDCFISGWKRNFMRQIARILILHDRTCMAKAEPTTRNIMRAITCGVKVGSEIGWANARTSSMFTGYDDNWETLVSNEAHRIYDSVDKDRVVE